MTSNWIPLQSIPRGGSVLRLDEPSLWETPLREFGIPCRIVEPVRAEVSILPQDKGVLFRGKITGVVAQPCNRCAEESITVINHSFDSFEPLPHDPLRPVDEDEVEEDEADEAVIRLTPYGGNVEVNPAALAWEEFSLALPVNPVCSESCKGLCPVCGNNRNNEGCTCSVDAGDPRLAALRGLSLNGKK